MRALARRCLFWALQEGCLQGVCYREMSPLKGNLRVSVNVMVHPV